MLDRLTKGRAWRRAVFAWLVTLLVASPAGAAESRLLYVAAPGIRNDLRYGGAGILVFDIDHEHRFVKRIETPHTPRPSRRI